jgi:hypothetical protein
MGRINMAFLIVVACCVVGLIVGGAVGDGSTAALGFFAGVAFGLVFARMRTLSGRIEALRRDRPSAVYGVRCNPAG